MKSTYTALFIFLAVSAFAQKDETANFVNQIISKVVPPNFEYYNLIDSSLKIDFDQYSIERQDSSYLLSQYPDFSIADFINLGKNSLKINWGNYNLYKARVYSLDSIPSYPTSTRMTRFVNYYISNQKYDSLQKSRSYDEIIVKAKPNWSKKRAEKEADKEWDIYLRSFRTENKETFSISKPIFSTNGKFAIITIGTNSGGRSYICKKEENNWVVVLKFGGWVY